MILNVIAFAFLANVINALTRSSSIPLGIAPQVQPRQIAVQRPDAEVQILSQSQDVSPDGSFNSNFETSDGTSMQQQGSIKNAGNPDTESQEIIGSFKYTSPEGQIFEVKYVANELGYQPSGDHLPTPPPIPAEIQRALDWIAAHPPVEEKRIRPPIVA